jgi:hypothetical protein
VNAKEDLLERGFQLAYFIFPSRPQAIKILSGAINKLKAQRGRENRRTYWRDKYLKRGITRISREDGDMLQWLIFHESDQYEKEQEASHGASVGDMVGRYIKSLVRMTSAMSSFHVNIGLHRLLHNYSTLEAQRVYESVTDRYPGADEYRRAKSVLMVKVGARFGAMLRTCRTQHGEVRFESSEQQSIWAELVDACLKAFTPWSTSNACPVPSNFDGSGQNLPARLSGSGANQGDQNQVEINRCHAFIDPVCYGRLVRGLAIEPPGRRLDLPRFFMDNADSSNHSSQSPPPSQLSAEERKAIIGAADAQAERRKKAEPTALNLVLDGKERARLQLAVDARTQFVIDEGAELLEIWTEDQDGPLLLAAHKIAYAETNGIAPASFSLALKRGASLTVQISASVEFHEGPRQSVVSLQCLAPARGKERRPGWLGMAPKLGLASAALIALGWFLGSSARRQEFALQPTPPDFVNRSTSSPTPQPAATPNADANVREAVMTYRLVSDDLNTRGNAGAETPSVVVPPHPALLHLELPVASSDAGKSFHCALKPLMKNEHILTEERLRARRVAAGLTVVTFSLPSTFLDADSDYTVDLRTRGPKGELEDLGSYTFHAASGAGGRN